MTKDNCLLKTYKVNEFFYKFISKSCVLNDVFDCIRYEDSNTWNVYSDDFNNKPIDIGILTDDQFNLVKNMVDESSDKITFLRTISQFFTQHNNKMSIVYNKKIAKHFGLVNRNEKINQIIDSPF